MLRSWTYLSAALVRRPETYQLWLYISCSYMSSLEACCQLVLVKATEYLLPPISGNVIISMQTSRFQYTATTFSLE